MYRSLAILKLVAVWAATVGVVASPVLASDCGCASPAANKAKNGCPRVGVSGTARTCCCARTTGRTCCGSRGGGAKVCRCVKKADEPKPTVPGSIVRTGNQAQADAIVAQVNDGAATVRQADAAAHDVSIDHRTLASERCAILCKRQC